MINFIDSSTILIVNDIETTLSELLPNYPIHSTRIIKNEEKEEFQIAQANQTIKEAYIATNEKKYIFVVSKKEMMKDRSKRYLQKSTDDALHIGNLIVWIIQEKNLRKKDIAQYLAVLPTTLNQYFKQPSVQVAILWRLSKALNYNLLMINGGLSSRVGSLLSGSFLPGFLSLNSLFFSGAD